VNSWLYQVKQYLDLVQNRGFPYLSPRFEIKSPNDMTRNWKILVSLETSRAGGSFYGL